MNLSWAESDVEGRKYDIELKDLIRFSKRTIIEEARIPYTQTIAAALKIHNCSVTLITFESCISQILVEEANPFESKTKLSEEVRRQSWARKTYTSIEDTGLLDDVINGERLMNSPPTMFTNEEESLESDSSLSMFKIQLQKIWWNGERLSSIYFKIRQIFCLFLMNIQSDISPSILSLSLLAIPIFFMWIGLIIETWYPVNEPRSNSLKIDSSVYNSKPLLINSPQYLPHRLMESLKNGSGVEIIKFFRYDITDVRNIKPQTFGLDFNKFLVEENRNIEVEVILNFNDTEVHSPAIAHQALMGSLASYITNDRLNASNIIVRNHPWIEERSFFDNHAHLMATFLINFMIGLLPVMSLKRLVEQNQIKLRLALLGIERIVFWLMTLVTDLSEIFLIFSLFGLLLKPFLEWSFSIERYLL